MPSVLIVDDQEEAAQALKEFFDLQGITSQATADGDEVLKLFAEHQPDLVLLDIRLEGSRIDGLEILEEARKRHVKSKIYVLTGYPDDATQARAMQLGADGYLVKPLGIDKLLELAKNINGEKP